MKLTELYDGHTFCQSLLEGAEDWNKEKSIDGLGRSSDKPRMECCEGQSGTIIYIRAVQGHSHGVTINPNMFSLRQIPLNWKDHIFHTEICCNYESVLQYGRWEGDLSFRSTRQACFSQI